MMKWLIRIYRLYMKGARENHFPISKYGFLPSPKRIREIEGEEG